MSENLNLKTIQTIDTSPFKHLCVTIGALPSSFIESMSYYECLAWLVSYLENTVIPAVNQNGEATAELQTAFIELKEFVDHYFDNLNVQEEINNKIDEMVESGEFQVILDEYVQPQINELNEKINSTKTELRGEITNAVGAEADIRSSADTALQNQISGLASGAPIPVASTSDMTDTTKIYLLTTDGHWYYYDGDSWEDGGAYQATVLDTDKTLTLHNNAADAEVVGNYDRFIKADLENLTFKKTLVLNEADFELGSIDVTTTPYSNVYSAQRIRTKSSAPIHLKKGDKIIVTNTNYWVFCTWKDSDNVEGNFTRFSANKEVTTEGDYRFVIYKKTAENITDISSYINIIYFETNEFDTINLASRQNHLLNMYDFTDMIEMGNINMGSATPSYSNSTTRARTLRPYETIHLNEGDIIKINNGYVAYIGYYKDSDGTFLHGSSWVNKFICPYDGKYIMCIRKNPESTLSLADINEIAQSIEIKHGYNIYNELEKEIKLNEATQYFVKGINHRGYNRFYPENTLIAFKHSYLLGFNAVETDVRFTSDGVAVLLHDESINRTARNADGTTISSTVNIADITYDEALEYDFGIYKGTQFAGTKIPTLNQFIELCKKLGLEMYIELKVAPIETQYNAVKAYDMEKHTTWISFSTNYLNQIKTLDSKARLGKLSSTISNNDITDCIGLKSDYNEVFIDLLSTNNISDYKASLISNGIKYEVYTPNTINDLDTIDMNYVSGMTSDWTPWNKKLAQIYIEG